MAADGRCSDSGAIISERVTKIFAEKSGVWLLGLAGYETLSRLPKRVRLFDDLPEDLDDAADDIAGRIQQKLRDDDWAPLARDGGGGPKTFDVSWLLGHASGRLWTDSAGSAMPVEPRQAVGSGWKFAHGAIDALLSSGMEDPAAIVRRAVEVTILNDAGCGGEVRVEHVSKALGGGHEAG